MRNLIEEVRSFLIEEQNDQYGLIMTNLDKMRYNDVSGYYASGGCYELALALNDLLKGSKLWMAGDETGEDLHSYIEYDGKYIDINGAHSTKDKVISDNDQMYPNGKITHRQVSSSYIMELSGPIEFNDKSIEELQKKLIGGQNEK